MWNANSLVQDLNSCRRVHFLRRWPFHHGHLLASWFSRSILSIFSLFLFFIWSMATFLKPIYIPIISISYTSNFFTPAFAYVLPMESEWPASLLNYLGLFRLTYLNDVGLCSRYFQFLQSFYQYINDNTQPTDYNWYYRHFHVTYFVSSLARSRYVYGFWLSFTFTQWPVGTTKSAIRLVLCILFFFFCDYN